MAFRTSSSRSVVHRERFCSLVRISIFILGCCWFTHAAPGESPPEIPEISSRVLLSHVKFLASRELAGRKAGTEHERIASVYIASRLEAAGVASTPSRKRYQTFELASPGKDSTARSRNVLGWIEGKDPELKADVVVLGAHLDHLGEAAGGICLGADDNASGVAVVLEVAGALAANAGALGRSVLVVFFGAEEAGLAGSRHFMKEPPVEIERVLAMVNVDMIGRPLADQLALRPLKKLARVDENGIGVVGAKDNPFLRETVDSACARVNVPVFGTKNIPLVSDIVESMAKNRGDHAPFEDAGIPTLFFGSGESDDYHKPTDTIEKLLPEVMARRAKAIFETVVLLSKAPREKLQKRKEK